MLPVYSLTLIRHGETNANKGKIIQGQQDTELSVKGEQQAQLLGQRLHNERFTHIYSSDLKRAHKTCELVLEGNQQSTHSIIKDKRLRERKFGEFEGCHSSEYLSAIKKAQKKYNEYTPPGGESILQLRERAINFFTDLTNRLRKLLEGSDNGNWDTPSGIKKRRHTSVGSDVFPSPDANKAFFDSYDFQNQNPLASSTAATSLATAHYLHVIGPTRGGASAQQPTVGNHTAEGVSSRGQLNSGSTSSTSGCSSMTPVESMEQLSEPYSPDLHTKDITGSSSQSSSASTEGGGGGGYGGEFTTTASSGEILPTEASGELAGPSPAVGTALQFSVCDSDIRTSIIQHKSFQHDCPNVSLSPIFEHRFPSMSSISSGRNNSFDDGDNGPTLLAEVLVVTHGGWLKELLSYFVEDLGCKVPGKKKHALQISPNTGLSKFTIAIGQEGELPKLTCISIHDKDHLVGYEMEMPLTKGEDE